MKLPSIREACLVVAVTASMAFSARAQPVGTHADEDAIQSVVRALVEAWNRGDGKAWAAQYAEDGEFVNVLGRVFDGRKAIEETHSHILSTTFKGSVAESRLRRLRWLGSEAAVVDVDFYIRDFERLPARLPRIWPDGSMRYRLQNVMVKRDGRWVIVSTENTPFMPPGP